MPDGRIGDPCGGRQDAAAVSHLRLGRRRQVDADRAPARTTPTLIMGDQLAALKRGVAQASAPPATTSISRCCSTGSRTSGSSASRSTSPIAISRRRGARSSSPTAPGHEQYTRNMATGASTADLAVLLVDARKGVLAQTRRHSLICSLLGIRHIVLAVNKLDLVGFDRAVFDRIAGDYAAFAADSASASVVTIPLSARHGDNVTERSAQHALVRGPAAARIPRERRDRRDRAADAPFRFPVQWVNRPNQRLSRVCRHGRGGLGGAGRPGRGDGLGAVVAGQGDRDLRRRPAARRGRRRGDPDVGGRDRRRRAATCWCRRTRPTEFADQFAAHLVWMKDETLVPGPLLLAEDRHPDRVGDASPR